jgi:hypothetical protein
MDSNLLSSPVVRENKKKIVEYTCGLFPFRYYRFPNGEFSIKVSSKMYHLFSEELVLLEKHLFELTPDLKKFYFNIKRSMYFKHQFPYKENKEGVLIFYNYFNEYIKEYFKFDKKIKC